MSESSRAQPFGFDRVFQTGEPRQAEPQDTTDHVHELLTRLAVIEADRQEELARARSEAFQAGLDAARAEASTALLSAADAIHAGLDDLDQRFADTVARHARAAAEIALAAGEALAGHAIDVAPLRAVEEALGRVLGQVARGTRLTIRVNPADHEALAALLLERQDRDRRRLHLVAEPDGAVPRGDAAIGWEEGGLAVNAAARRAAVLAALDPALRDETAG